MNSFFSQLFGTSSATSLTGSSAPAHSAYQTTTAPWWASESNANAPTPSLHVFDPHGHAVELADSSGRGGEALIHPVADRPEVLVKLYHPEVRARAERTQALRRKLAAMTCLTALHKDSRFAWPRFEVFDNQRRWLGFAMARVQGRPLTFLLAPALLRQELPHWDGRYLVAVAGNLAKHLDFLASHGVIVGDINPGNFLFDPANGKVSLIDCDSFQVKTATEMLPCPVVTPTHAAPELLALGRADAPRTVEMLRFSAAILFFQVLTVGVHPFQHQGCEDPAENIRTGLCAIGADSGAYLPPAAWQRYGKLPQYVKTLFIRTFRAGHANPAARPTLAEWVAAFRRLSTDLQHASQAAA